MYRFFVDEDQIDIPEKKVTITGEDVNHIRNVLRMRKGEEVSVAVSGDDREYRCSIRDLEKDTAVLDLLFIKENNVELPCESVLYQALPKADKMELIITKAVELGVSRVVPVATERSVVKLTADRAIKKTARWNAISETAAKQSKRAVIPEVSDVMTIREALDECRSFDVKIIPYELSDPGSMDETRRIIESIKPGSRIAIFIGPEGGYTEEEIAMAESAGFTPVTLGRRILRTETAGLVVLSWIMYNLENL
ncbi:MAG: 16S rRNA (uracil(1498)-N(3))-methyltransferase [Lachnospiraceae bacterium]|nr:16S rRNA (uracil(1498)-N(3))-methyltransferase [Lachnospiraceae bacterium]